MVIIRSRRLPRESAGKLDGYIVNQSLRPLICPCLFSLDISLHIFLSLSAALFQHTCKYPCRSIEYLLQTILLAILVYYNLLDCAATIFFNLVIECIYFSQRSLTHLLSIFVLHTL